MNWAWPDGKMSAEHHCHEHELVHELNYEALPDPEDNVPSGNGNETRGDIPAR